MWRQNRCTALTSFFELFFGGRGTEQGIYALEDNDVLVEARSADRSLVESVISSAQQKASAALGKDVKVGLSNQSLGDDCAGGVVVTTKDGRVRCDQRLEVRLEFLADKVYSVCCFAN